MRKILYLMLLIPHFAYASSFVAMNISVSNFTNNPGVVFLGTQKSIVTGPKIGINGATIAWSPNVKTSQGFGLVIGTTNIQPCFVNGGFLVLNPALYKGDAITIILGQDQSPTGITCGCFGSACAVG
jgi:hypothetical protein